jgi:hypothetical protein
MPARPALVGALAALALAAPAAAQSSLGLAAGGLSFGAVAEDGATHGRVEGWLDLAITAAHGLQLDLAVEDRAEGTLATVGGHLYLAPGPGRKYGFFGSVADLDGEGFTLGTAGAEGLWALGERTALEARLGVGIADRAAGGRLDFVFAGASVMHELGDVTLGLSAEIAEYDETGFRAIGSTVMLEADWRPRGSPITVSAGIGVSDLSGSDGRPAETVARLSVGLSFGAAADPARRPFRRSDPYGPLALRGLF